MPNINTLQLAGDDFPPEIVFTNNDEALAQFMSALNQWARKDCANLVWFLNLGYDLQALLLGYPQWLLRLAETGYLKISWTSATLEIFAGKLWFAKFRFGTRRGGWLLDAFRFTFASLEKSAQVFAPGAPKLPHPEDLGEREFHESDSAFCEYAIQDAVTIYRIGQALSGVMQSYDVPICVSAPQLSARVFRKHYVKREWENPNREVEDWAVRSFHGGLTRALPGYYERLAEYDFSSAYPYAMTQLGTPVAYEYVSGWAGPNGIYHIRGKCDDETYPILFSDSFKPLGSRSEAYAFCTGYELQAARERGEFNGKILRGVLVHFDSEDTALRDFVNHFYREKDEAKQRGDLISAEINKKLLNCLYGKMIQANATDRGDFKPGGIWSPFMASLITGFTRARLHSLEHESGSVHSATDAVKTARALPESRGLGGLEKQCEGPCLIVRGKVYAHLDEPSGLWKFAAHGLGVTNKALAFAMLTRFRNAKGNPVTKRSRVIGFKSARIRGLPVLSWLDEELQITSPIPRVPLEFAEKLQGYLTTII